MIYKNISVKEVAEGVSNCTYAENLQAAKELMELFDYLKDNKMLGFGTDSFKTAKDYVKTYDDSFYTYQTWDALIQSEEEQTDGLTEIECRMEINQTIFQLPCGWYVQYV